MIKLVLLTLTSGWSGATPKRLKPKGVGNNSNKSTEVFSLPAKLNNRVAE